MDKKIFFGMMVCIVSGQAAFAGEAGAWQPQATAPTASQAAPADPGTQMPDRPPQASPSTSAPATSSPDYVIGPSDSLEINVWKEPTLSGTLPVRPDGMISLALVGDLQAAGLTPMQLSAAVSARLKRFITDPLVNVTVLGVNSRKVFLLGEIAKPGEVPLTAGMTPLQAIAAAGGLSPYANSKKIYILRSSAGKQQKIEFNYKKAIKDGNLQGVTLVTGDTIVVP